MKVHGTAQEKWLELVYRELMFDHERPSHVLRAHVHVYITNRLQTISPWHPPEPASTQFSVVMGSTDQCLRAWWKESSVYQVYPASYQDSTGSGVGDLKGIISRVDYLKDLGVDIVWLSPIFKSPQVDMVCCHLFSPLSKNQQYCIVY